MITLYSGPVSWFSRKVEIALIEKRLPFSQILVPFSQTRGYYERPEDVTRIHPKRQVPVLIDDGTEIYDSTIIMEYLDEAYPAPALLPKTAAARAQCRMWEAFGDEVMLEPIRKLMHRTEPHDHGSDQWLTLEAGAVSTLPRIEALFDRLEQGLPTGDHLCTDFSVADISCFMAVFWSNRLAGPGFGGRERLRRWYRGLLARPSIARVTGEILAQDRALSAPVAGAHDLAT